VGRLRWLKIGKSAPVGAATSTHPKRLPTRPETLPAKLASGFVVSAWLDNNTSGQFGGELRYDYEHTDLKLSSDGTSVSFGGAPNQRDPL